MVSRSVGSLALLLCTAHALGLPAAARAASACGRAGKPWVSVAFAGDAWTPESSSVVLADLRAELSLQGFEACALGTRGSQPPLALIEITSEQADRVRVVIGVHDAITEKRVVRDVDLAEVSDDGRGLAVAVAADELLRASWAELTLQDAPEPAMAPPPEVESTLKASMAAAYREPPAVRQSLGARFAIEHHTGGQTWLGGDALLGLWFGERVGGELRVGARDGLTIEADNGRVESSAFLGAAALRVALIERGRALEVTAGAGISAASVQLSGRAAEGALQSEGAAFGIGLHAGASVGLQVAGPLELRLDLEVGAPLREVEAVDAQRVVSSTGGVALQGGLGLGVRL